MFLLALHGVCFCLVVVYVNMFQFWAWLSKELGPGMLAKMLPVIVTLVVLLLITFRFIRRINKGYRIKFVFLGLGIVGAFLALAIPDPNVPIKRIHVAEYIVLSFLVRYVLSHRLRGLNLVIFTAIATALYGVHDEMLQGLHSLRYYGWRDIIVNAMAGLSGALLGHGLVCFDEQESKENSSSQPSVTAGQIILFLVLLAAVVWQVIYLYHHRKDAVSMFVLIPVVGSCSVIGALYPATVFNSREHHGLQTAFWLSLLLAAYPVIAGLKWIEFL